MPMSVQEVLQGLNLVMNKSNALSIGRMFLKSLKPEDVIRALEGQTSLVKLCFNHWRLAHPSVKPLAKAVLQTNYRELEKLLTDVPEVFQILSENHQIFTVLNTPRGRAWLNQQCRDLYTAVYVYCWTNADPLENSGFPNPYKRIS